MINKIMSFFCITICIFALFNINVAATEVSDPETYGFYIFDEADLLTKDQEKKLEKYIGKSLNYGNIAIITSDSVYTDTDTFAENFLYEHFNNESSTAFVIDMDNRNIFVSNIGENMHRISSAKCDEITSDVYTYATDENYYRCCQEALANIESALTGKIRVYPLRIITGFLTGMVISMLICITIVIKQRKIKYCVDDLTFNKNDANVDINPVLIYETKRYRSSDSSGGGGGGGGSSGGGGGGGSSGGGHSF